MKSSVVVLLPVAASAASIWPRQAKSAYKTETKPLKAQMRSNSQRNLYRVGPIDLKPGLSGRSGISLDSNGQGIMFNVPKGLFCGGQDCTVLSGKAGLQFDDGTVGDVSKGVYIHHILSSNAAKKVQPWVSQCDYADVASVKRPAAQSAGFVGVSDNNGDEPIMYGTKDGKIEGGYHLKKDDQIGVWLDLVNLNKEPKKLWLTYDLEYLLGDHGVDSQGTLISVTGCNVGKKIQAPASGPANTTSNKFKFFQDGYLVNGKGHLHDGGVAMDLSINGKYACSSNALYGGASGTATKSDGTKWETISGMAICPGPIEVKEGDYMTLTSRYDLTQHPLRENGDHKMAEIMGTWTMNFLPKVKAA